MSSIIDDELEQKAAEEHEVESLAEARAVKIAALRAFADFLEQHPDAELPFGSFYALEHVVSREELVTRAKALGGRWQKVGSDEHFELHRCFGGEIYYGLFGFRAAICEAVVVGQETVTHEEVDPEAPKIKRTETRDVIEWRCPDSLLGDGVSTLMALDGER